MGLPGRSQLLQDGSEVSSLTLRPVQSLLIYQDVTRQPLWLAALTPGAGFPWYTYSSSKGCQEGSIETAQHCMFVLPHHSLRLNIAPYRNSRNNTQLENATSFLSIFANFVSAKRRKQLTLNLEASIVRTKPESGIPSVFCVTSVSVTSALPSPPLCRPACHKRVF